MKCPNCGKDVPAGDNYWIRTKVAGYEEFCSKECYDEFLNRILEASRQERKEAEGNA